ncbi:unnamed protein product [Rhizophagus irregularis]|nr:unnamed protein product [Rhizophagus irregularis]
MPAKASANLSIPPIPRTSKASKVPPKQLRSDQLIPLWKKLSKGERKCQEVLTCLDIKLNKVSIKWIATTSLVREPALYQYQHGKMVD